MVESVSSALSPSSDEPELPPAVARVKAKLEASTGKTYSYRPKNATPSIQEMLVHGSPGDGSNPRTWSEKARYPFLMAILFCVTFFLFLRFAPKPTTPPFILPTTKNAKLMEERIRIIQQQRQKAAAAATHTQADPSKSATGAGEL